VLRRWAHSHEVVAVLVHGRGRPGKPAAFCAGGDIRFFHEAALAGDPRLEDFFSEEYALNHLIHHYPKPTIALMDGIVMGGGMGISQGATLRVVTEGSRLAMPETQIGLFPDVGGGWFLSRCPGHVGEYLALAGTTVGAADAIAFGLADEFVPAAQLPMLIEALVDQPCDSGEQALAAVRARAEAVPAPVLAARQAAIDRHFGQHGLAQIVASLQADEDDFARETLAALQRRSPLMMAVTLEQVRRARRRSSANDMRRAIWCGTASIFARARRARRSRASAHSRSTRTTRGAGSRRASKTSRLRWSRPSSTARGPRTRTRYAT